MILSDLFSSRAGLICVVKTGKENEFQRTETDH